MKIENYIAFARHQGFTPFIFDDFEPIRYKVGDFLNIGLYRYKVLDIRKYRVVCERIGLV